ncbi:MAG: transporter [Prevotella sp.]|nr:transporter [Prevotella sp.]
MNIRYGILIMTLAGGIASANAQETLKPTEQLQAIDSLALPRLNYLGQMAQPTHRWYGMSPVYGGIGWDNWELHKGLNMNLGASVFAQFGKHARHGAGFSQNIAAMYAMPLSKNLSFAAGGYLNNTYWGHDTYRDAGLSAVLGYRFNDHWEAYLYGQKSLVSSNYIPYSLYDMNALGDRIGAAVKYNVNKNFSITLSVDKEWVPNNRWKMKSEE